MAATRGRAVSAPGGGRIVEGFGADAVARIAEPGVALAVWRRTPAPDFREWLDGLPAGALPAARFSAPAERAPEALAAVCAVLPDAPGRAVLAEDAAALALGFAATMKAARLRVRVERVETDACRRFHVDRVPARLICTYRGPGTEYGWSGTGPAPAAVERLGRCHVGVFRGSLWPAPGALVHRSPPIEGTGTVRLTLIVDVEDDDL